MWSQLVLLLVLLRYSGPLAAHSTLAPLNGNRRETNGSQFRPLTDEERLIDNLMVNYHTVSRPVFDASHSVVVSFGLALVQIQRMVSRPSSVMFSR